MDCIEEHAPYTHPYELIPDRRNELLPLRVLARDELLPFRFDGGKEQTLVDGKEMYIDKFNLVPT